MLKAATGSESLMQSLWLGQSLPMVQYADHLMALIHPEAPSNEQARIGSTITHFVFGPQEIEQKYGDDLSCS